MPYSPPTWDAVELAFRGGYTPPAWDAVELPFGPEAIEQGSAQAQSSSGSGFAGIAAGAVLTAQVQSAIGTAVVILRPVVRISSGVRWTPGEATDQRSRLAYQEAAIRDRRLRPGWSAGDVVDASTRLAWSQSAAIDTRQRLPLIHVSPERQRTLVLEMPWHQTTPQDIRARLPFEDAPDRHTRGARTRWTNPPAHDRRVKLPWGLGEARDVRYVMARGTATPMDIRARLPWGPGGAPQMVYLPPPPVIVIPPPPPLPCYLPPDADAVELPFLAALGYRPPPLDAVDLDFFCARFGAGLVFRIHRSLRLQHSLLVVRLPDRLPLHVTSVQMSTDRDSFAWSFGLRFGDRASLLAVAPSPAGVTSVEINLDGHVWTALIESYTEDRALAQRTSTGSGRSRTALFAAPYATPRAYISEAPATAQQLILAELGFSEFGLTFGLDDWTVPPGAFAYERSTPMEAIIQIASAAGGIVQAARGEDTFLIQPRYPIAPWQLQASTPDVIIDAGSVINLGKRYAPGPAYQGVYVSGRDQGVLVNVTREGTPGTPYAPMVVDPLIVDVTPAIGRGKSVIAAAYTREQINLLLPVTPSPAPPGILVPGTHLQVIDPTWGNYRALVESCSITAEVSGEGVVTARQTAQVERFLEPAIVLPP